MKNKRYRNVLITAIIFLIVINLSYFWEGELGFFYLFAVVFLIGVYIALFTYLLRVIYVSIREKFRKNRERNIMMVSLTVVLSLIVIEPDGFIDFESKDGEEVLYAFHEGGGNCFSDLSLKENHTFIYTNVCFGREIIRGKYEVSRDTIIFDCNKDFFKYAVCDAVGPAFFRDNPLKYKALRLYEENDTIPGYLYIKENKLIE